MKYIKVLLLTLLISAGVKTYASHIIGGEIVYTCLGANQYQVTLILYRDCQSLTGFDNPAYMTIFTDAGDLVTNFPLYSPTITDVPAESDNPCLDAPDEICVEQAIYTTTITVPNSDQGYLLVYQRCCRNAGIVNITDPDNTGATYQQEIPPGADADCNNSPEFNDFPPTVICLDDPIIFDHSATDPDGDSLAYKFYWPYVGASPGDPAPPTASYPPYYGVDWVVGYDETYPLDALPAFAVNATTGLMTGTANAEGRYVVGVACEEYRDGVLLGTHIRDFQFNVVACTPLVVATFDVGDITFSDVTPDEEYLNCENFLVDFNNNSTGGTSYSWDFGDGATSTVEDPSHTYGDTGTYYVMLIVNPGFVCADTALGVIKLYNTLTADYSFNAGCSGTPVDFTDLSNSTEAGNIVDWDWNFGDGSTSTESDPDYEYGDGGTYSVTLTVTTDVGCESSITYDVLVESGPAVDFVVDDVCQNEFAVFNNLSTITTGTITDYLWDFGDGNTSTVEEPTYQYAAPGDYTVTLIVYSANGCSDTMMHDIHIGELPFADAGADASVGYLDTYTLNGSGVGSFTWEAIPPLNGLYDTISSIFVAKPTIELEQTTTFIVTVVSPDGCSETDTVVIYVIPETIVDVPNAFSPNGDGTNDEIFVITHDVGQLLEYSIYNRWGEQIFTTTDLGKGWNGQIEGEDAEMGTYVYVVRAIAIDGLSIQKQGNITLVR